MRTLKATLIFLVIVVLSISAQAPRTMNYQGKLTDDSGIAVTGPVSITFRIYDVVSGGTALWSEAHASVTVTNGLFDVILGEGTPMTMDFDEQYWMELVVGGETLSPREKLAAVPYSHRAVYSDTAGYVAPGGTNWTLSGTDIYNNNSGNVGIGTNTPDSPVDVEFSSSSTSNLMLASALRISNSNATDNNEASIIFAGGGATRGPAIQAKFTDHTAQNADLGLWTLSGGGLSKRITVKDDGNVGISVSSPSNRLEVSGEASYFSAANMGTDDADFASKAYVDDAVSAGGDQNLTEVLEVGNSAGSYDINMNDNDILDANIVETNQLRDGDGGSEIQLLDGLDVYNNYLRNTGTSFEGGVPVMDNLLPHADATYNLGSSSLAWQNLYIDNWAYIAHLQMTGNINMNGNYIYNSSLTSFPDGVAIREDLVPQSEDLYDLGQPTLEWQNLYIDGTAYLDALNMDGNIDMDGNYIFDADNIRFQAESNYIIQVNADTDDGIYYNNTANTWAWHEDGVERAFIDLNNGNFATDGDVNVGDDLYLYSNIYDGSSWGTSGQVLKTTGSSVYWAADETGSGITSINSQTGPAYTINAGAGLGASEGSNEITLNLSTSGVTPGAYTNANITVDSYGRITTASNGSAGTDDQTLSEVLASGNSAGGSSINMNNQDITNVDDIYVNDLYDYSTGSSINVWDDLDLNDNDLTDVENLYVDNIYSADVTPFMIRSNCEFMGGIHDGSNYGSPGQVLKTNGTDDVYWADDNTGSGVSGSGTDNYLARWNGTSALQNSAVYVTDGGNVGIGTTSPSQELELVGDMMISGSGTRTLTMQSASAGNVILDLKPNITGDQLAYLNSTYGFQFKTNTSGTSVDALRITNTGNVGIGTTSPASKLSVNGSGASNRAIYGYADASNGSYPTAVYGEAVWNPTSGYSSAYGVYGKATTELTTSGAYAGRFEGHGDVAGGTAYGIYATATGPSTNWAGFFDDGNVYVKNNVGIGTTTPASKLAVGGSGSSSYGVYSQGSGYAFYGNGSTYGLYAIAGYCGVHGYTSTGAYGVYGQTAGSGGTGGYFTNTSTTTANQYGVQGFATGASTSGNGYGVRGGANGSGKSTNYGVYGTARNATNNYGLYCSGSGGYTGSWLNLSDVKFKKNIKPMTGILEKVLLLQPKTFEMKTEEYGFMNLNEGLQFGLIAQELQEIFPELVKPGMHPDENNEGNIEYLSIDYIPLTSILIQSIKEQQAIIDNQQQTIGSQQEQINSQGEQIEQLMQRIEALENK